jgi:primosomal protein N'
MKARKSKRLAAVIAAIDTPRRQTKAEREFLAWIADYPFNMRDAVFCWLWANHAEVSDLRARWDKPTWQAIARIMQDDGVTGARGEPPNANSVRRVWGRVCREIAARPKTTGEGQQSR